MYRTSGWYRPHFNSVMKSLFQPVGAVNREQFVLSYYSRISPIDSSSPSTAARHVTAFENLAFTATPKAPSSGVALTVSWKIDGVLQPGATAATFTTTSDALGNGTHTITATVRDPTAFVRNDPASLVDDTLTWTLHLSGQLPATLSAWRAAYGSDAANPSGDGLSNFVKYALGLDPSQPAQPSQRPTTTLAPDAGGPYLTLTIPRRTRRTDVEYVVEISSDLTAWNTGPGHIVTVQDLDDLLVVRDAQPISAHPRRVLRVRIVEPL
jgi:hypothetical protein